MILLTGQNVILLNKIIKINVSKYIYIYIYILIKNFGWGAIAPPPSQYMPQSLPM